MDRRERQRAAQLPGVQAGRPAPPDRGGGQRAALQDELARRQGGARRRARQRTGHGTGMSGVRNGAEPEVAVGPQILGAPLHDGRTQEGAPEDQLIIFDTTLRDGEQSPGATMNIDQKLQIAQQLERLGAGVSQAGFPASWPGDFSAVSAIAETIETVTVAGLARIWPEEDVLKAADAITGAKHPRIHTFVGTSPLHRAMVSWAKSPQESLHPAGGAVKAAKPVLT